MNRFGARLLTWLRSPKPMATSPFCATMLCEQLGCYDEAQGRRAERRRSRR
jgi:hypothetical protein